ncbi:MAG: DUF2238 domain-containing protein [Gemmatimonadota bacterium]
MSPTSSRSLPVVLGVVLAVLLAVSGASPYERSTWLLEVAPILIAVPVMLFSYRRFPLTPLLYSLIFLHAVILLVGGAYTYARVPLGFWMQELLGLDRNPYDKIGHFAQGLVPALVAREVLARGDYVRGRKMLAFICLSIAMAISACYELVEWGAALALGQGADEFLGTQGYVWDTQSDMWYALLGATASLLVLSRWHDRQMAAVEPDGMNRKSPTSNT